MIEMVRQRDAKCCAQRLADLAPVSLMGGLLGSRYRDLHALPKVAL